MTNPHWRRRDAVLMSDRPPEAEQRLLTTLGDPVLARLYAARGVTDPAELSLRLGDLLPAASLTGLDQAIQTMDEAIDAQQAILIIGDFDADGATSTALMMLALREMGARVDYLVPDRFRYGYGLTPEIVQLALTEYSPSLIVTVDNGISSHAGVALAQQQGIRVLITDHHLTSKAVPPAEAVVNPNQPDCQFASKALCGVGVAFYVLAALSSLRRAAGKSHTPLVQWLDLVAVGTVADVGVLDHNNRILVANGLQRLRQGRCRPGFLALLEGAGRNPSQLTAQDLGFVLGPRINAAGRMDTMRIGIDCLLAPTLEAARPFAEQLEALNRERRRVESDMKQSALAMLEARRAFEKNTLKTMALDKSDLQTCTLETSTLDTSTLEKSTPEEHWPQRGIVLADRDWHQGVIGIIAGRLKEQYHRPSVVFAPADDSATLYKGSARSIAGIHIRDVIEQVALRYPETILHFGGHAMAAGLSIVPEQLEAFQRAFEEVLQEADERHFQPMLFTDGALSADQISLSLAERLSQAGPWGNGFPPPVFEGEFDIVSEKILKDKHSRFQLRPAEGGEWLEAIAFNQLLPPGNTSTRLRMVYQLDINEFRGQRRLQLQIVAMEPV